MPSSQLDLKRINKKPTTSRTSTSSGVPTTLMQAPAGYVEWLGEVKARIHAAQQRAAMEVNRELIALYWRIGRDILDRQAEAGWGAGILERISSDLRAAFPEMRGFSRSNLLYSVPLPMRGRTRTQLSNSLLDNWRGARTWCC